MKRKSVILAIGLALTLSAGSISFLMLNNMNAHASCVMSNGESVSGVYHINDYFIPGDDAKIIVDGKEYNPENIYCIYPNGEIKTAKYFLLNQYGKYSFVYEVTLNGKLYSAEQHLSIKKDYYYFNNNESSLIYDSLDSSFVASGFAEGLNLEMAEGDTFYISEPINLYEQDVTNLINYKVVQRGSPVVKYTSIRITDCYNPDIYIDVSISRGDLEYQTYVKAGFKGSGMLGLQPDGTGLISIDGINYSINSVNGQGDGTQIASSYKTYDENNMTINSSTFYFDNSNPNRPRIYVETDRSPAYNLVREFNNPDISSAVFPGFTTGLVYLTLTASSFNGVSYAPIQIASINGKSGKSLLPMDFYEDKIAPIITIDAKNESNTIIGGKPVKLPTASVIDDTGVRGTYSVSVFYDSQSESSKRNVDLTHDENGNIFFVPNQLGNYVAEYRAYDVYGNVGVASLKLNASSFDKGAFDFQVEEIKNVEAGRNVYFNNYQIKTINDLSRIYVNLTKPDGSVEQITDLSKPYFLDCAGKYDVQYVFEDPFYSDSHEYSFIASNSSKYSFDVERISTPKYFIDNATYSLNYEEAFLYTDKGKIYEPTNVYVRYDSGDYEKVVNYSNFVIDNSKGNTVQFKFACSKDESIFIESEAREIVDINYSSSRTELENFFIGDFAKSRQTDHCEYISNVAGTNTLDFVNPVSWESFELQFSIPKDTQIESLKFTLTDYINPTITHEIILSSYNVMTVDGVNSTDLDSNWKNSGDTLSIYKNKNKFNCGSKSVDFNDNFNSDLILLSIEFNGVSTSDVAFNVYKLCNQKFNNMNQDRVAPIITVDGPTSVASIGDTITVYKPTCSDVLSPSSLDNCVLTVLFNNEPLIANDGTSLNGLKNPNKNYEITVPDYGKITYTYSFIDGSNRQNRTEISYKTYIYDVEAPILKLASKTDKQKASDYVPLMSYEVSDNLTEKENITVYFVAYDEHSLYISSCTAGKGLTIKNKGLYTVYVYAYDEAGNFAYDSYQLTIY